MWVDSKMAGSLVRYLLLKGAAMGDGVLVENGLDATLCNGYAFEGRVGLGLRVRQEAPRKLRPVKHLLFLYVCRNRFGVEAGGVEPRGVTLLNVPEAPASPPPYR